MKELIELQENSGRQFSELMSKINEQKEYLTKEIEALIETKQELELELKNLVDEIKDEILPFVTTWMDLQSITLATKLQNARGSCLKIVKGKPYQVEWGRPCHWISCDCQLCHRRMQHTSIPKVPVVWPKDQKCECQVTRDPCSAVYKPLGSARVCVKVCLCS
ncbi:uncharacterized protein RBU33_016232 isoform 1-T5 [Hipposideros larvatus]